MTFKGFSKKVFPQLGLPKIKMFRYLPRPFSSSPRTALWKLPPDRLFRARVSSATSNHSPLQSSCSSLDFIPFATTSLDTSKILRRGVFLFLVFLAVPSRSTTFRCCHTGLLCSRWGAVDQIGMIYRLNILAIFFCCVSPGAIIIGVNRRKIHLNGVVVLEIISYSQPSACMR